MATAKKAPNQAPAKKAAPKAAAPAKAAAPKKAAAAPKAAAAAPAALKPIKASFTKAALATHLAEHSGVEPKAVKAVLASLEATIVASLNKKGLGEFTLPGLLKITSQKVPATKRRFGTDPFTKQERWFDAKPATVRVKSRALKKLKDAAVA
ncbi:HU family DNA-binding protein [Xylophilus sp.]|uniref:HU family DNA-binding protein n=1 Tax=Xylophilus sp. TaxID=2653893 RepID=UPI0013BA3B9A|nr:HU family DNA-binding protein [Xylophilus sp.]KAF1049464.1 MAG: hypothetical protein GAK38_00556 [Xylophilus sp.]